LSTTPTFIALGVAGVFGLTIMAFILYNCFVEARQLAILEKAAHSTAIVSSLFPKQVCERLLEHEEKPSTISRNKFSAYLQGENNQLPASRNQIADLFPNCTVMFADIAGFTAWSSTRDPEHVFVMLQTVYQSFDEVARRRKVFKVETIGDSYLAATGLPEPQSTHAVIMARFACECRQKMNQLTKELEVTLGPDCSELKMRFGMHSGPVTAGVLRGDRARFQLFGDTVNTGKMNQHLIISRCNSYYNVAIHNITLHLIIQSHFS
jgi:Adenylate and Guanylate cyclase catalytic domain